MMKTNAPVSVAPSLEDPEKDPIFPGPIPMFSTKKFRDPAAAIPAAMQSLDKSFDVVTTIASIAEMLRANMLNRDDRSAPELNDAEEYALLNAVFLLSAAHADDLADTEQLFADRHVIKENGNA